jgi:hypothetical protein
MLINTDAGVAQKTQKILHKSARHTHMGADAAIEATRLHKRQFASHHTCKLGMPDMGRGEGEAGEDLSMCVMVVGVPRGRTELRVLSPSSPCPCLHGRHLLRIKAEGMRQ